LENKVKVATTALKTKAIINDVWFSLLDGSSKSYALDI
jgi:hypothetical protein